MKYVFGGCLGFILLGLFVFVGFSCRYVKNASDTAFEQFAPSELLKRYEWFKDAAAKLEAKAANIKVAEASLTTIEKQYDGVPRKDWPRTDLETHSVRQQEIAGLKASFNLLAADYNARMVKANYRFCNEGDLPRGADKPLPREFKPYLEN